MDRHARSPPPVFSSVTWKRASPLAPLGRRGARLAPFPPAPPQLATNLAAEDRKPPSPPPYCRAVLSRQSWPRNAISMGFFWGPVPKPPLYRPPTLSPRPRTLLPLVPYLAMGIQFSRSPSPPRRRNFSRNFALPFFIPLSRWERDVRSSSTHTHIYIYTHSWWMDG